MSHDTKSDERAEQVPNSVRLDFLESIRPSLLLKVLAPHAEFFRRRSVDLDPTNMDDALHARLYEILNAEDQEVPEQLRRTIVHLTAMSSDPGFEALVDAAEQQGEQGFVERAAQLNKHELAVDTYLRLPQVFSAARGRVRSQLPQRYIEYYPRTQRSIDDAQFRAHLEPFRAALRKHFAQRTGSDFCQILSAPRREHEMLVCHAGAPRMSTCILRNGQRGREEAWTEERDELILDRQTGRMAIRTESPADREFYKRAVGQAFFGDDECFGGGAVYTGAPLVEQGLGALSSDGIDGLRRIELLEVRLRDRGIERTWIQPDAAVFSSAEWARATVRAQVHRLRLALHLSNRQYPAQVEIVPPNTIILDRRFVAQYAYAFLLRRGFMLRHAGCA